MSFRWPLLALGALLVSAIFAYMHYGPNGANDGRAEEQKRIFVASIVEIDPIRQLREGFESRLADSPISSDIVYIHRNAQGDPGLIAQIASEVERTQPDLVYVLGTPLAQAIQTRTPEITLVQGAVTDPVEAGLADSWDGSGRNYAANSDRPPADRIIELITGLTPEVRTLGFLYNPGESNSVAVLRSMQRAAASSNIRIREFAIGSTSELPSALNAALAASDAIFIPPDNAVTSGIEGIVQSATRSNRPVFATTEDAVAVGALAGVATNFRSLGEQAGEIALRILVQGQNPSEIPIALPTDMDVVINEATARTLGISIPSSLEYRRFQGE